jgi:flagellar biosynthesis/type III secretory pathway chaperone
MTVTDRNTQAPAAPVQHALDVEELKRLVEELCALLRNEFTAMESQSLDSLNESLGRKDVVLQQIVHRETDLARLFQHSGEDPGVIALAASVRACHELNERNKAMAQVQLSHTRKSLELLRSMLKMNDVPVYGASGQVSISREKRDHGCA